MQKIGLQKTLKIKGFGLAQFLQIEKYKTLNRRYKNEA